METKQLLKHSVKDFIKTTKGNEKELFALKSYDGSYWIYNGYLLTTNVFNLKYAVKHEKVSIANLEKDTVYILSQIDTTNRGNLFNI